ncbi:hypothetical protein ACFUN8_31480 [Streptomyces sp. NPDC057307]|uniref:hypothetical protein n=1 Tax=Streptomyces sp. NPDC057307 TaxID=3346096 RepID=UPI00363BE0CB
MSAEHRPEYPARTPSPPKRPVRPPQPARPTSDTKPKSAAPAPHGRARMSMINRRAATWGLEAAPWTAAKASGAVVARLRDWGYPATDRAARDLTALLVSTAVADGGRRVSVHLADQDRQALIVALSHRTGLTVADETLLPQLAALGAVSCGTDTAVDGRRLWAVLDL